MRGLLLQMWEGGALEDENDLLQEQVAGLQDEVSRLEKSPFQAARSPKAAFGADVQAFTEAGCLLELSDNARLVLAAYAVSLATSDGLKLTTPDHHKLTFLSLSIAIIAGRSLVSA